MGQTLTHGVYLPDEGERNCYSGLAANWSILDGAVGTIAEHSTQIAGKAPAVHTHTKSDITDFPAYGNTAGTICEGNDSRLSDARTPVAHTHTKSDVTDLLNSNFIPSANNSYNLGSSSYQWKSVYAQSYYYNGVAWGLDKANEWTKSNTFSGATNCIISFKFGTSGSYSDIRWLDNNNSNYAALRCKTSSLVLGLQYSTASAWYDGSSITINNNGSVSIKSYNGTDTQYTYFKNNAVYPSVSSVTDLGTSTNKWKTLNGVNPGALSLPDMSSGTGVSLSAGSNSYSPPSSGWLSINLTGAISVVCGNFCHSGTDMLSVPVVKGSTYTVTVATSGTAYLFVSQGNV